MRGSNAEEPTIGKQRNQPLNPTRDGRVLKLGRTQNSTTSSSLPTTFISTGFKSSVKDKPRV